MRTGCSFRERWQPRTSGGNIINSNSSRLNGVSLGWRDRCSLRSSESKPFLGIIWKNFVIELVVLYGAQHITYEVCH